MNDTIVCSLIGLFVIGIYALVALHTGYGASPAKTNLNGATDVSVLARESKRLEAMPGARWLLPSSPGLARLLGLTLILLGLGPILVPEGLMFAYPPDKAFVWMPRPDDPNLGQDIKSLIFFAVITLYVFRGVLRTGWAMLRLPSACRRVGWDYAAWAMTTKRLPSTFGLMMRDQSLGRSQMLFWSTMGAYLMSLVGLLLLFPLMGGGLIPAVVGGGMIAGSGQIRRWASRKALEGIEPSKILKPTVYLRGFKDDAAYTRRLSNWSSVTVEEAIIRGLLTGGRSVVALGKPGEKLPPLGAQRFYVPDDQWQQVIGEWIDRSFAIVMVATDTMATLWEKEQVFLRRAFDRFLILFAGALEYDQRAQTRKSLFAGKKGREPLTIGWETPGSPEQITFDRLQTIGVKGAHFDVIPKGYHLIGTAFDGDGSARLFIAKCAKLESLLEVIKWHIHHVQGLESNRELGGAALPPLPQKGGNLGAGITVGLAALFLAVMLTHWLDTASLSANRTAEQSSQQDQTNGVAASSAPPTGTDGSPVNDLLARATAGDATAQEQLGEAYFDGKGVEQDYSKSLDWQQAAARQNNALAMDKIGYIYRHGLGVTRDDQAALSWYQKSADLGCADGQSDVGFMYEFGFAVPKDYQMAMVWYQKAADQGNAGAQVALGRFYFKGLGVEKDGQQAFAWFQKAADNGNASAESALGLMYHHGVGVDQDYPKAFFWSQKAADQGDAQGENGLGELYHTGMGVAQDDEQALAWFQKSADKGNADGEYNLGNMYMNGNGVAKDPEKAISLFTKAAAQGNIAARQALDNPGATP